MTSAIAWRMRSSPTSCVERPDQAAILRMFSRSSPHSLMYVHLPRSTKRTSSFFSIVIAIVLSLSVIGRFGRGCVIAPQYGLVSQAAHGLESIHVDAVQRAACGLPHLDPKPAAPVAGLDDHHLGFLLALSDAFQA